MKLSAEFASADAQVVQARKEIDRMRREGFIVSAMFWERIVNDLEELHTNAADAIAMTLTIGATLVEASARLDRMGEGA